MYMSCWFSIKVNIIFCLEMCLVEQTWFTQAESNLKEILVTTGKRGIDNKKTIMNNHLQRNAKLSLFFCTHFNPDTWIQMQMICIKYCKQTSGNIQLHPTSSNFIQLPNLMWFSADTEHSASFLRLAEYTRNVCRWRGVQVLRVAKVLRGNNGNNKPKVRTLKALKALKAHQTMNLIFRLEYAWICLNLTIVDSWTAHINFHHLSLRFTKSQPPTRCRRAVDKTWHGRDGHCGMAWAQRWKRRNLSHQHFEGLAIRPCLSRSGEGAPSGSKWQYPKIAVPAWGSVSCVQIRHVLCACAESIAGLLNLYVSNSRMILINFDIL